MSGRRPPASCRAWSGGPAALLGLALLLLPGAARAEVGLGLYTSFPLVAGLEVAAGSHLGWEVALAGGITPAPYARLVGDLAEDGSSAELVESTLAGSFGVGLRLRVFPKRGLGVFLGGGYDLLRLAGDSRTAATVRQALEEPDTGGGLAPGGDEPGPDPGGGDGAEADAAATSRRVAAVVQALQVAVGYRHFFGPVYLQGELSLLKAIAASVSPAELQDELGATFTDSLLVPGVGLALGLRL